MAVGKAETRQDPRLVIDGTAYYPSTALTRELGISRQTLWRWRKERNIPQGHRFRDGSVVFTDQEVREIRQFAFRVEPGIEEIYLDNNATTPVLPEVREAVLEALGSTFGNPSSVHDAGERGRGHLRRAREGVAGLIGAAPERILFTSGATEANNLVLRSALGQVEKPRVVTTTIEHSSVLRTCAFLESAGVEVVYLPVRRDGIVSLDAAEEAITPGTTLVSVQWVNNETGAIQPVGDLGARCRTLGVPFHIDAAQAAGRVPIGVEAMPVDFLSISGHKLHAPPGVGALYARDRSWLTPLLYGGPQEEGLRAGTENIPGIVGLGRAAELRQSRFEEVNEQLAELRDRFEEKLMDLLPEVERNGDATRRVGNTANLRFRGVDGQALVVRLDQLGIRCSQSSACTNMRPEPSYVLRAMGLSEEEAYSSVRFSFSELNTPQHADTAAEEVAKIAKQLRRFLSRRTAVS